VNVTCPTDCSGHDSTRQHEVDRQKLIDVGVPEEEWLSKAWKCGYCDCVYSYEWDSCNRETVTTERGYFRGNTLMVPENWEPVDPLNAIVKLGR